MGQGEGEEGFFLVGGPEGEGAVVGAGDEGVFVDECDAVDAALGERV